MSLTPRLTLRRNLRMTEAASNRIVVLMAMMDITHRRLPKHLWSHPSVAIMLGVNNDVVALTQAYLEHRRRPGPWMQRELRLVQGGANARLWDTSAGVPLDLVTLPTKSDEVRLTHLLSLGTFQGWRVDRDLLHRVERMIGRSCGQSWSSLEEALTAQRAAAAQERTAAA